MLKSLYLILFLSFSLTLSAQWAQLNSPSGGTAHDILINKGRVLITVYQSGVFVSDDNCSSWTKSNTGLGNLNGNSFFVSNDSIFLSTDRGIYLSVNNGDSWTRIFPQVQRAHSFGNYNHILYVNQLDTVLKSVDAGQTWNISLTPGPGKTLRKPLHYDSLNNMVFVSNYDSVYVNTSNTWQRYLPPPGGQMNFGNIGNKWVGIIFSQRKIYRKTSTGSGWTVVHTYTAGSTCRLFTVSNKMYVTILNGPKTDILQSADSGLTWSHGAPCRLLLR